MPPPVWARALTLTLTRTLTLTLTLTLTPTLSLTLALTLTPTLTLALTQTLTLTLTITLALTRPGRELPRGDRAQHDRPHPHHAQGGRLVGAATLTLPTDHWP